MKKGKKLLALLLCFALVLSMCALGLAACNDDGKSVGKSGVLDKTSISVEIGRTGNLTYKGSGVATWSVEDDGIATVKALIGGKMCAVTGVSEGTTTVTATYSGGKKAKATVTVTKRNVLTVTSGGQSVTRLEIEKDATAQLAVSSNIGSKRFKWTTGNKNVATVTDKGLVKGVFPGKTTVKVEVDGDADTYVSIPVTVNAKAGATEYILKYGEEAGTQEWVEADNAFSGDEIPADQFYMWHARAGWGQQTVEFSKEPTYSNGLISFAYTSDWNPGMWFGMNIIYKHPDHTVGDTYKLNCKINVKSASLVDDATQEKTELDSFTVNLNGNNIVLNKGMNNVEVFYVYTAPRGQGGISSFDLQMGWEDPSNNNGWFLQNGDIEISDISWTHDTPVQLQVPSFTYADNKISVTDPNEEGVGSYRALFYKDGKPVGSSMLNNGEPFNTKMLNKGTYTVKIQAVGKNAHYLDSAESTSEVTIEVTTDASYTLTKNGAIAEALAKPGTWSYWAQTWVTITTAEHSAGTTTLEFGNNAGTFDALQLYYKNPDNVAGKKYKLTVDIELTGDDDGGLVIFNGHNIMLEPDKHTYELGYIEDAKAASFTMLVATVTDGNQIPDGKLVISNLSWTEISSPTPLGTPTGVTATVTDDVATVKFNADVKGANLGYEIGFFKDASSQTPTIKATARTGEAEVSLEFLGTGTYVVKVRAKGDGILYAAYSAWSQPSASFDYTNAKGDVYELPDNADTPATSVPGTWTYYAQAWVNNKGTQNHLQPTHSEGKVNASFENNVGAFDALLFCYDHPEAVNGKTYTVKMTITVENAVITNDGNKGGEDYVGADHAVEGATDFCVIVSGNNYELETGTHTYTFELTKGASELFVILFSQWDDTATKKFNRLISADIAIEDLVITAK